MIMKKAHILKAWHLALTLLEMWYMSESTTSGELDFTRVGISVVSSVCSVSLLTCLVTHAALP